MNIQTQRIIVMILIIITFITIVFSSIFAFDRTTTIKSRLIFGIGVFTP